jgi:hypothetical protein
MKHNGAFVVAWGRIGLLPPFVTEHMKSKDGDGSGKAQLFLDWCNKEVAPYR